MPAAATDSDISTHKEVNAQKAELLERLALATQVASVGIWELDLTTRLLTWDDRMCEMYGIPKTTLLPETSWAALVHPDDLSIAEAAEQAVIEKRTQGTLEFRIIRPDGQTRTIYAAEGVVTNEHGTVTRVIGVNLDITERKRTEEALAKSQALLNETNRIAKIGGWELDIATGSQVWTDEVYRIHEVHRTYQPTVSSGIDFYAPASRPLIAQAVQRAIEVGEPFDLELEFITAKGQQRWVHSIGKADQEHAKVFGTIHDITDRKQQEQEIHRLNATLEQQVQERTAQLAAAVADLERAAKMKDEFMAAVSHELRTPLTGVLGMAEALEMQSSGQLNERQVRYVQSIHQSGERLLSMINSILRYTNLMAGNVTIRQESCRLAELCAIGVCAVRERAEQKGQTVEFSVEPVGLAIISDADGIIQTIRQLLDNAIKFTPVGGQMGLEVHSDADEDSVCLVVWDTGLGIAPEQQATIFQPFVQGDGSLARHFGGVGLGLAFVRRTVELLGGTIALESALGEGSRFTITLPVTPV